MKVWESWRGFLDLLFPMIGTVALICYITPLFALVVPVLAFFALKVQKYYRCSSRELKRLASVARSPMYDWFSCTLDGLATIRAHELGLAFARESAVRSDEANRMQYIQKICDRWLGTRLEMMGNFLCFVAMVLGVLQARSGSGALSGASSPALIGLSLASAMRLARITNYTVRQFTQLESEMTSVERVLHYIGLPTEQYTSDSSVSKEPISAAGSIGDSGSICFENAMMRYRPGLPLVLKGVTHASSMITYI